MVLKKWANTVLAETNFRFQIRFSLLIQLLNLISGENSRVYSAKEGPYSTTGIAETFFSRGTRGFEIDPRRRHVFN